MKRFWLSIMAVLLVTAAAVPAFAWEFSMTGEYEYRMRYFSRTGPKDIFGNAELQNVPNAIVSDSGWYGDVGLPATVTSTSPYFVGAAAGTNAGWIGLAGPNIYMTGWQATTQSATTTAPDARPFMNTNAATSGVSITRGGFSRYGSDAIYADQRLTFVPSFRVNNAIRVHGTYTVGGLRQKYAQRRVDAWGETSPGTAPYERYYMLNSGDAAYNTGAIGSWEQVRATIQLPVATVSIGKKDFVFGNGAIFAQNYPTDSFFVVVPYGPIRLLAGSYPAHGTQVQNFGYDVRPDIGTKFSWRYPAGLTYDGGPLSLGVLVILGSYHLDRGDNNGTVGAGYGLDVNDGIYMAYMKYTNGRFFLNADWMTRNTDYYKIKATTTAVSAAAAPQYTEGYMFWAEGGVIAGPGKLSLMYAASSGPVLNNYGAAYDATYRQSKAYGGAFYNVNYQALEPYSFLMFPTYGGGNNQFNADGTGQMGDAFAFGARLDYATAANLNLFGSFLWAHRLEKAGTYAGQYYATSYFAPSATSTTRVTQAQTFKGVATGPTGGNPYVDDGLIGWEAQAGFDWKLLEGFNMSFAYSYWRLGEWFDQAYQAFTYQSTSEQAGNTGQGLMQGRDAIQSLRGQFTISF